MAYFNHNSNEEVTFRYETVGEYEVYLDSETGLTKNVMFCFHLWNYESLIFNKSLLNAIACLVVVDATDYRSLTYFTGTPPLQFRHLNCSLKCGKFT